MARPVRGAVFSTGRDTGRSPGRHNTALYSIAGPEHLEGEVSRYVSRLRHRERQLNIAAGCAAAGNAKPTPSLAGASRTGETEKRCVGCSLVPAAERSKAISTRGCWFEAPVCAEQTGAVHVGGSLRTMDCGGMLRRAPQRDMGRSLPPWPPAGADAQAPTHRTLRRQSEARELRRACCMGALGRAARSPGGEVSDKMGSRQRGRKVSRNAAGGSATCDQAEGSES